MVENRNRKHFNVCQSYNKMPVIKVSRKIAYTYWQPKGLATTVIDTLKNVL